MRLVQVSAWNDSGGGFTHRLLDGHPALRSWPFELLLGRDRYSVDSFGEDWFRGRFRWPRLGQAISAADGGALFDLVSDAELKGMLRDPVAAKHRGFPIPVALDDWRAETVRRWTVPGPRTQAAFLDAYVDGFFALLEGREDVRTTLAHCPVAILDAPETWADFPDARFLCVIRSPLPGFADMSRRHPGLEPARYAMKWSLVNGASALWAGKSPDRVRIVTLRQLLTRRERTMEELCGWLDLAFDPVLLTPTWRGRPLAETAMGPFGGVPSLSTAREQTLASGLDPDIRDTLERGTAAVADLLAALGVAVDLG